MNKKTIAAFFLATGLSVVAVAASSPTGVKVYRLDGSRQCSSEPGRTPDQDAADLRSTEVGVSKILSTEKRRAPGVVVTLCGAPTGRVNVVGIPQSEWATLQSKILAQHFQRWIYDSSKLEIFQYTGELQCFGGGHSIEYFEKVLSDAHIMYANPRSDVDHLNHIALCGASSGNIFVFQIASTRFEAAHKLGFSLLDDLNVLGSATFKKSARVLSVGGDDDLFPWPW